MLYAGNAGNEISTYFPAFSNFRFGNNVLANLGGSSAALSGSFLPQQNYNIANFEPVTFPWLNNPIQTIGDITPNQALPPGSQQQPGGATPDVAAGADSSGENRIVHVFKLQFIAMIALVLLAIGLYLLSQQTAVGRSIKEKAVDTAKSAAEVAVVA